MTFASAATHAAEFVKFVDAACTPFHAVYHVKDMLLRANYRQLNEGKVWPALERGGRYFVTRNDSSIVAFALGGKFDPANGIKIVGTHTDSPDFQLKPKSGIKKGGYQGVGVQCYGGGLWHTWFDRELTVAGRVLVQVTPAEGPAYIDKRLLHIRKPLMRIPSLAIHLRSQPERDAFAPGKESHLVPIIASEVAIAANRSSSTEATVAAGASSEETPSVLIKCICDAIACAPGDILDFDLHVVDTQPPAIGGAFDEFVFSPRIDNLLSCFCAAKALVATDASVADDDMVRMVAMFDHEEVGSESASGAHGTLVNDLIERICAVGGTTPGGGSQRAACTANSFLLSVDCAHGAHPNYLDKHEENHRPQLHLGPVIKYNANTRYATNGLTGAVVKALAKKGNVPVQQFCVKNDSPCGTTIGPILSTLCGIGAADIGNAMWSMHSVRETCGTVDIEHMTTLLSTFFSSYQEVKPQGEISIC